MRALLFIAFLQFGLQPSAAQDPTGKYAESPYNSWFTTQHNVAGNWCCLVADAHLYYGAYTTNADGSIDAPDGVGGTVHIGAEKVLPYNPKDPNPTGNSVWWYNYPDGLGAPTADTTYCFALGPLS